MANGWTRLRRERQADLIKFWKPWERSSALRTADGKAISARNAYRGATRQWLRELQRAMQEVEAVRRRIVGLRLATLSRRLGFSKAVV
jgi:hypothetical protein